MTCVSRRLAKAFGKLDLEKPWHVRVLPATHPVEYESKELQLQSIFILVATAGETKLKGSVLTNRDCASAGQGMVQKAN